jgi:hypothetical protein
LKPKSNVSISLGINVPQTFNLYSDHSLSGRGLMRFGPWEGKNQKLRALIAGSKFDLVVTGIEMNAAVGFERKIP